MANFWLMFESSLPDSEYMIYFDDSRIRRAIWLHILYHAPYKTIQVVSIRGRVWNCGGIGVFVDNKDKGREGLSIGFFQTIGAIHYYENTHNEVVPSYDRFHEPWWKYYSWTGSRSSPFSAIYRQKLNTPTLFTKTGFTKHKIQRILWI